MANKIGVTDADPKFEDLVKLRKIEPDSDISEPKSSICTHKSNTPQISHSIINFI
jgi:hypothetical protein